MNTNDLTRPLLPHERRAQFEKTLQRKFYVGVCVAVLFSLVGLGLIIISLFPDFVAVAHSNSGDDPLFIGIAFLFIGPAVIWFHNRIFQQYKKTLKANITQDCWVTVEKKWVRSDRRSRFVSVAYVSDNAAHTNPICMQILWFSALSLKHMGEHPAKAQGYINPRTHEIDLIDTPYEILVVFNARHIKQAVERYPDAVS